MMINCIIINKHKSMLLHCQIEIYKKRKKKEMGRGETPLLLNYSLLIYTSIFNHSDRKMKMKMKMMSLAFSFFVLLPLFSQLSAFYTCKIKLYVILI
jgi:hypothetical protein